MALIFLLDYLNKNKVFPIENKIDGLARVENGSILSDAGAKAKGDRITPWDCCLFYCIGAIVLNLKNFLSCYGL